jgi:hypothetical protein
VDQWIVEHDPQPPLEVIYIQGRPVAQPDPLL